MSKIYYFTDIHGYKKLYEEVIKYCGNNQIIFGGDAADRGPDGYSIMKDLLARDNIIYLKGNHEQLFVNAAREFKSHFPNPQFDINRLEQILKTMFIFDYKYSAIQLLCYNGGKNTLKDWFLDGMPMDIVEKLDKLPITHSYKNLDFCHAGGTYQCFCKQNKTAIDIEYCLWDRDSFNYGWAPDRICIHGHTPVNATPYKTSIIQPIKYYGKWKEEYTGAKIDMDAGIYISGKIFILNCDTLEVCGFQHITSESSPTFIPLFSF